MLETEVAVREEQYIQKRSQFTQYASFKRQGLQIVRDKQAPGGFNHIVFLALETEIQYI